MTTALLVAMLLAADGGQTVDAGTPLGPCSTKQTICFSPIGKCDIPLVEMINKATKTLEVAIYAINRVEVVDAIIKAAARGVSVRMLLDTSQIGQDREANQLDRLMAAGVPMKRDTHSGSMHMKVAIVDDTWFSTGSFNFTTNASVNNNENLLIWSCPRNAILYRQEFDRLWRTFKDAREQIQKSLGDAGVAVVDAGAVVGDSGR